MTRSLSSSPVPTSLLAAIVAKHDAAASVAAGDVTAAREQYWLVVDRLAASDESGGIDPSSFEAILAVLGLTLDNVRNDVATVQRVRQARTDLDAAHAERDNAVADQSAKGAAYAAAKNSLEGLRIVAERAAWRVSEADSAITELRLLIRNELRGVEAGLRAAGFAGELLPSLPPSPSKRRWRMLDVGNPQGRYMKAGSEIDYPYDYVPDHRFFALVGVVTPDTPPPKQVPVPVVPEGQRAPEGVVPEDMSPIGTVETEV